MREDVRLRFSGAGLCGAARKHRLEAQRGLRVVWLRVSRYRAVLAVCARLLTTLPQAEKFAAKSLREKAADFKGQAGLAAQVFLDQCVHHPFMYFPAFYMTKEVVCLGMEASPTKVYERWSENFWPDLFALWKLWVPATAMNFAFSPMWMRIPVGLDIFDLDLYPVFHAGRVRRDRGGSQRRGLAREGRGAGRGSDAWFWGVDARAAELFAQGLARRVSNVDDYLEKSPVVRSLTRRVTPAEQQEPKPVQTQGLAHLCVTASGRDSVGLVTQLSKWIYDRGGSITGLCVEIKLDAIDAIYDRGRR